MKQLSTILLRSFRKKAGKLYISLCLTVFFSWALNAQQSYTFTPCAATGTAGPTQAQVNTAYASTNLNGNVTVSGIGIQQWTVPINGLYRIETYGAEGGSAAGPNPGASGGKGAVMIGDFNLMAGQTLSIVAGQKGGGSNAGGGGGGGSYIIAAANTPLCIAGGGGGGTGTTGSSSYADGFPGLTTTSGGNSNVIGGGYGVAATGSGGGTAGNGGTNGYGGGSGVGAGGGGFNGDGANGGTVSSPTYDGGGKSYANGAGGGWGSPILNSGGFGGGGGTWASAGYGGGGGGYSGGGGGSLSGNTGNGGGGGSFNSGINQNNTAGLNLGDGKVIITSLCNVDVAGTSSLICAGNSVTLTTTAVSNYSWSTGSTTSSIVVSPATTTTYSVSGTGSNPAGCTSTVAITVTVNTTPTVSINSTTLSACLGQTVGLTASGVNSYTWAGSLGNNAAITVTPSANTGYTVSGTNACGTASAAVTVTVSALPILVSTSSATVCAAAATTLNAGGATTYTWMPGSNTQTNYIVSPTANTVYTVTGKTGNCLGTNTIAIYTKPNPTITIVATTTTVCDGDVASLTANGGLTYTWNPVVSSNTTIAVSPTVSTLYSVVGINSVNCTASAAQVIVVRPKPVINVTASDPVVCPAGSSTLTATGTSTSYAWTTGSTGSTIVVNPGVNTTYSVTGTNSANCVNTATIAVSVFDPTLTVSSSTAVCRGTNVNLSASGADAYHWSTGSAFSSISVTPTITTTYTVDGSSTQGLVTCSVSGAVTVSVNPNPTVTASSSPTIICKGESAVITAGGATTYTFVSATPTVASSMTVAPTADQTYTVMGENTNGCKGTGSILLRVAGCVGINGHTANTVNLSVYPNPSNGDFVISSDQAIDLQITNELGQLIKTISLSNVNKEVKISNLASGIYFITGKNENGDVKQKIIVAK